MKTILVPTDFSRPAELAVEVATDIARKAEGEIVLLHVIESPLTESFNVEGQVSDFDDWEDRLFTLKLIQKGKQQLAATCEKISSSGIPVTYRLKMGNPFHGIRTEITEQKADMVVMGTSGRSKFEEMVIGSNTEKVVRHAKCPVLTVHQKASSADFKNIVYATSMSPEELPFANVILDAQSLYGAKVHLIRVNTPNNFRCDTDVKKEMEDFAKRLGLINYTLNVFNDITEEQGIIDFANAINADLIAMATHGRTGFAHLLTGSIAENVANHAAKPVLTYVINGK